MDSIPSRKYYTVISMNKAIAAHKVWMNFTNIALSKRSQAKKRTYSMCSAKVLLDLGLVMLVCSHCEKLLSL